MNAVHPFSGDPFAVVKKCHGRKGLFFLDSSRTGDEGRYSYIGFAPFKTVAGRDLNVLRKSWASCRRSAAQEYFTGGAVGYIGYDGNFYFGFYDRVFVFDHARQKVILHAPHRAALKDMEQELFRAPPLPMAPRQYTGPRAFKSNFTRAGYIAAVKKALKHIYQGDIYQINLSRRETLDIPALTDLDAIALYGVLRRRSPSPFAAYFEGADTAILSSSPERFMRVRGKAVEVKPMKGTRPRGRTAREDAALKKDLLTSSKEIAELLMVTDLERNDLGRVCVYGSVKVKAMRTIEAYAQVFQATAAIQGNLRGDKDIFDAIEAAFPSGSVTGCPKIEAMRVIKDIEGINRGLYTGALGYIGFNGAADFSVLIRSIFLKKKSLEFYVGGGIVADSDPAAEYEETCIKAQAMQAALSEVLYGK